MRALISIIKQVILMIIYYSKSRKYSDGIFNHIRSRKKNNKAFLIATGPSIKTQDLRLLAGEDCYTISNAFLHEQISNIKPILHGFAAYHKPMIEDEFSLWLRKSDIALPPETGVVTPLDNKRFIDGIFNKRPVFFLMNSYGVRIRNFWPILFQSFFPSPQSGPLLILPILIMAGYKEIYLIGCDHDVLKNYGADVENFYSKGEDVRSNATSSNVWGDIRGELEATISLLDQYDFYAGLAKRRNIKIYNLSQTSWLSQFPKRHFAEVVVEK